MKIQDLNPGIVRLNPAFKCFITSEHTIIPLTTLCLDNENKILFFQNKSDLPPLLLREVINLSSVLDNNIQVKIGNSEHSKALLGIKIEQPQIIFI